MKFQTRITFGSVFFFFEIHINISFKKEYNEEENTFKGESERER